jgi:hypothetical protein
VIEEMNAASAPLNVLGLLALTITPAGRRGFQTFFAPSISSIIPESGYRFSEKIVLQQRAKA